MEELKKLVEIITITVGGFFVVYSLPRSQERLGNELWCSSR